ncbi:MAG: hypothetical protein Q4F66_06500 [Clostridium sp.]|nr:hypothetical protein [Clostridium sp.]
MNSSLQFKSLKSPIIFILLIITTLFFLGCGNDYGEKLTYRKVNNLYYTSNVTEDEADSLGTYLLKNDFFSKEHGIDMRLDKKNGTYEVRFIVKKGLENDADVINKYKIMCSELSNNVFNKKEVDIILCDDNFNDLRTVVALY